MIVWAGGDLYNNRVFDDIWALNLTSLQWYSPRVTALPAGRMFHTAVMYNDELYTFGGADLTTTYNDFWRYNLTEPPLPPTTATQPSTSDQTTNAPENTTSAIETSLQTKGFLGSVTSSKGGMATTELLGKYMRAISHYLGIIVGVVGGAIVLTIVVVISIVLTRRKTTTQKENTKLPALIQVQLNKASSVEFGSSGPITTPGDYGSTTVPNEVSINQTFPRGLKREFSTWEIDFEDIEIQQEIGQGSFGVVSKVVGIKGNA